MKKFFPCWLFLVLFLVLSAAGSAEANTAWDLVQNLGYGGVYPVGGTLKVASLTCYQINLATLGTTSQCNLIESDSSTTSHAIHNRPAAQAIILELQALGASVVSADSQTLSCSVDNLVCTQQPDSDSDWKCTFQVSSERLQ